MNREDETITKRFIPKKMIGIFFLVLVLSFMLSAMCGCSSSSSISTEDGYSLREKGTLSVLTSLNSPPFEYFEGSNPSGYSIAIIEEIANRLGLEVELTNVDAQDYEQGVQKCLDLLEEGDGDIAVACLTASMLADSGLDYTYPYFEANQVILVKKDLYQNREDLKDQTIIALEDSPSFRYAIVSISDKVQSCHSLDEGLEMIDSNQAAALVLDSQQAQKILNQEESTYMALEEIIVADQYVIAVNGADSKLADTMSEIIQSMDEDGTLEQLQNQYL